MATRHAIILNHNAVPEELETVDKYLPHNYKAAVLQLYQFHDGEALEGRYIVISGEDFAGWTLDGYVIPRLASGLYVAQEIDLSHNYNVVEWAQPIDVQHLKLDRPIVSVQVAHSFVRWQVLDNDGVRTGGDPIPSDVSFDEGGNGEAWVLDRCFNVPGFRPGDVYLVVKDCRVAGEGEEAS